MPSIGRKHLLHKVPLGASSSPEAEVFFITVCCLPRGKNQLAKAEVWQVIDDSLTVREKSGELRVRLALVMPDHLHGLFSFPDSESIQRVVCSLKEWVAKQAGIRWQRDFFDHRLRSWESSVEKANYIRQNPVRAGLVTRSEDWPFQRTGQPSA